MSLNWINPNDYSFNSFLLMERFQIRMMLEDKNDKWRYNFGIALNANPAVMWYLAHRCPEYNTIIESITINAPTITDAKLIRNAEIFCLDRVHDFITYTTPVIMAEKCEWIHGWNKENLFSIVDLNGKTVLDVGAGSGRLTFAAAEKAAWVYSSEPVETLREFIRVKAKEEGIKNIRVLDGFANNLAFPNNTFDVVMSGHVVGDDYDNEIAEITRVCKPGGWLVDCPGDSYEDMKPSEKNRERGWEEINYTGSFGKNVYCYRKQVRK